MHGNVRYGLDVYDVRHSPTYRNRRRNRTRLRDVYALPLTRACGPTLSHKGRGYESRVELKWFPWLRHPGRRSTGNRGYPLRSWLLPLNAFQFEEGNAVVLVEHEAQLHVHRHHVIEFHTITKATVVAGWLMVN